MSPLVGIDDSDLHLTGISVAVYAKARCIRPRHGFRHPLHPKVTALETNAVRHGDLDLTHDGRHLDLGRAGVKSRVPEVETDLPHERADPEAIGKLPVARALGRR